MKLRINKQILSDIINLERNVFKPLKKFSSKIEVNSISNNFLTENNLFFPIPVLFPIDKETRKKIIKEKTIDIFFLNKFVGKVKINEIFHINKNQIKKIYGFYSLRHPGIKNFFNTDNFYIDCKVIKFNKKILNQFNFNDPISIKKKIKNQSCAGFHTRNVPHNGHIWIHNFGKKYCKQILIQPMVGQYKKGEFNESSLIETNKIAVKLDAKKSIFSSFFSYPRYAGPREAIFHAIVRKNYGCTHFLVGRDHAGYKNYFKKYSSQKMCTKFESRVGIKILIFKEPFLCKICKKVINKQCKKCKKTTKVLISGTKIRRLIKNNKVVPDYLMVNKIYEKINKYSLIN